MITTTSSASLPMSSSAAPRSGWKQTAGFATGGLLALSGLVLGAAAVIPFAVRTAAGQAAEPSWWVGVRCACGLLLVMLGFCVMVLNARELEAGDAAEAVRPEDPAKIAASDELLCTQCGAANDNLARYCDQCGRRLS